VSSSFITPTEADRPVGVFDSGIGGLSVLRHIRALLPHEHLLYFADSGFAPYGGKSEEAIVERTLTIAEFLLARSAKALVVACNTATAAAIKALRARYPVLPLVGVEPGLKPAAALSTSKIVGVLATKGTLASDKFNVLREQISASSGVRFLPQPCIGLADQVEKGELHSAATAILIRGYVAPLIEQGADTLVLGCTHYLFVLPLIEEAARRAGATPVKIVDTSEPIARQLVRLLGEHGLQRKIQDAGALESFTSGSETALKSAFANLLKLHPPVARIDAKSRAAGVI
jgi:glutamate racemase